MDNETKNDLKLIKWFIILALIVFIGLTIGFKLDRQPAGPVIAPVPGIEATGTVQVILATTTPAITKAATTAGRPVVKPVYKPVVVMSTAVTKEHVIDLVNNERIGLGLTPLKDNPLLDAAAEKKLADMIGNKYFAHNRPNGDLPWVFYKAVGYGWKRAGENLGEGNWTVQDLVGAWMASPAHFANISQDDFAETGVAIGTGEYIKSGAPNEDLRLLGQQVTIVVQFFGRPIQ